MPRTVKRCVPCLAENLKKVLLANIKDEAAEEQIKALPDCSTGILLDFCLGKTKRRPSEYQLFVSQCMKSKNIHKFGEAAQAMKGCAEEWRRQKPAKA